MSEETDDLWQAYAKGVKKIDAPAKKIVPKAKKKTKSSEQIQEERDTSYPEAWMKLTEEPPAKIKTKKEKIQDLLAQEKNRKQKPEPIEEKKEAPKPKKESKKDEPPLPLDPRIERNLSLGDVMIEAKLDLHGKTEKEAHELLLTFIEHQALAKKRVVLVITGRGKDGTSILKRNVPRWCEVPPLRTFIRALRSAAPHHGGDGAYYVLLKK